MTALLFHDIYLLDPAESGFTGAAADRYKLSKREFAAAVNAIGRAGSRVSTDADDAAGGDTTLLTVDDGGASFGGLFADEVERRDWRAFVFMSTDMIGHRGFLDAVALRDLDARGHVVGSHSASHPTRFSACDWRTMVREWRDSRVALEDCLGHRVRVASLPGGYFSTDVARSAAEAGLDVLFTSEPVRGVRRVGGCSVVGRYTVRPGVSMRDLESVAGGGQLPLLRQRAVWTVKKIIKPVLGSAYPRLGAWLPVRRRSF
jgi:peptidoglycan/xylan/chitin deacetylase (PgdA/CDA1 family)